MAGCLPVESIRKSTLECLYNDSCINILSLQPNISRPKSLKMFSSKFLPNMTIGSMFDESLFIESWKSTYNFEEYFRACAPRSLTFTYQGRFRLHVIFTICVSAFGGLIIIWDLITPAIVKILNLFKWRKQRRPSTTAILSDQMNAKQNKLKMSRKPIIKGLGINRDFLEISFILRENKNHLLM